MQRVYEFLKKCDTYYLATTDGDQPRVRPMGTIDLFEGKLYFQTGRSKNVSKQMAQNPKVEICGMADGKWIRIEAVVVDDDRPEPKRHMLAEYPSLQPMYSAEDSYMQVLYLKNATATISSFIEDPVVITF